MFATLRQWINVIYLDGDMRTTKFADTLTQNLYECGRINRIAQCGAGL